LKKSIFSLVFILLWLASLSSGDKEALTIFPGPVFGLPTQVNSVSENGGLRHPFHQAEDLLQIRSGGHLIGFQPDRVYMTGIGYALIEEFVGTDGVTPVRVSGDQKDRVEYPKLWKGITAIYEAQKGAIAESTFVVQPLADVGQIKIRYNTDVQLQKDGSLRFIHPTRRGYFTQSPPLAWQEIGGRKKTVPVTFRMENDRTVGFQVGDYDPRFALVIDPIYQWHTFYGSGQSEAGLAMAVDSSGNVYITGYSGTSWLGDSDTLPKHPHSEGGYDLFVLKLDSGGGYQWHTFYGAAGWSDQGNGIAIDQSGNIYISGQSSRSWLGDGGTDPRNPGYGSSDLFVLKLDSAGAYQWHTFYGSSGVEVGNAIATDGSGNAYVTGYSETTWNGPAPDNTLPVHGHSGGYDLFVLKLATSGAYQWHTFYGSGVYDPGLAIAANSSGTGVAVTGKVHGNLYEVVIQPKHPYSGAEKIIVLKLDGNGAYQWHTYYGSGISGSDQGQGIGIDGRGSIVVTGSSNTSWQGDDNTNPKHAYGGINDIFVLKLNSTGDYQWHTFYGSDNNEYAYGLTSDRFNNIYVTGSCSKGIWYGAGPTDPLNPLHAHSGASGYDNSDVCLLKLNPEGFYLWHTFYGSPGDGSGAFDAGYGIGVDGAGSIYVGGYTINPGWNLSPPLHNASGSNDVFALKLAEPCVSPPSGMVSWWRAENNTNDVFGINNGTLQNGAGFSTGAVGQAFSFTVDGAIVTIPHHTALLLDSNPAATFDGWFRSTGGDSMVIGKHSAGIGWFFTTGQGCYFGDHHIGGAGLGGLNLNDGLFHHFACVKDGTTYREYIDGELLAEDTGPVTGTPDYGPVEIGRYEFGAQLTGIVDELEVFHRALSTAEIQAIYNAGSAGKCIPDQSPGNFTFSDVTNAERNTVYESNVLTVSGIDYATPTSISGGIDSGYAISTDGGSSWSGWTNSTGTVNLNDQVKVRQTSSPNFSTSTDTTLTIGGVSDTFRVTTRDAFLYLPLILKN
jgi:hypothetical protein